MEDERSKLNGYIKGTARDRKVLLFVFLFGVVASLGCWIFWVPQYGKIALACFIGTQVVGHYITGMHLRDWHARLKELDKS